MSISSHASVLSRVADLRVTTLELLRVTASVHIMLLWCNHLMWYFLRAPISWN